MPGMAKRATRWVPQKMMKRWLRRLAILLFVLLWALLMILPFTAFTLATRGEIVIGSNPGSHVRLFLLQGVPEQGVGMEWSRVSGEVAGCLRSNVYYFLWEGEATNAAFCQCFDAESGESLPALGASCMPP